jgi:superfamily II DNA or RNA helicase
VYTLRDYQAELIEEVRGAYKRVRRVLMVLPTGGGKTVIFAYITEGAAQKGNRICIVAHREEIVDQISTALDEMGVRHGRIQAGHTMTDDPVQVAMIQTLARRHNRFQPPDLIVIDECHHAVANSYANVTALCPEARILGVTATPERLDGKGLWPQFDELVIGATPGELMAAGFLAGYEYLAPPSRVNLAGIRTIAGDFDQAALAEAVDRVVITGDAVEHYRRHLHPRTALVFAIRVDHAEHIAAQFREAGFRAASVDGSMDKAERRRRVRGIGNGELDVLVSCMLLGEGLDVPSVGGVILLRPTQSLSMHLQQIGRALRPKADGAKAIILDHVGNVRRHGLPDAARDWSLADRKRNGPADVLVCPGCDRVFSRESSTWRKDAIEAGDQGACEALGGGALPHGCVLAQRVPEPAVWVPPEPAQGRLIQYVSDGANGAVDLRPEWAGGFHLVDSKGWAYFRLLERADTREKLEAISSARGYKRGWVGHVLAEREAKQPRLEV